MRVLSIVESAYRASAEEQDDTILWLTAMCQGAGLDVTVVLCGDAVNYGVTGHQPAAVEIGGRRVAVPPAPDEDLAGLAEAGVELLYVDEDRAELGIDAGRLLDRMSPVKRSELPALCGGFDQVWHW